MNQLPRDVEVEVTFLPTEHGGFTAPIGSGSRPQFYCAGADWIAQLAFIDGDVVRPGQTARAYVTFAHPDELLSTLKAGSPFLLRAGQRVVAYGRVLRVIDLDESAKARGRLTSA